MEKVCVPQTILGSIGNSSGAVYHYNNMIIYILLASLAVSLVRSNAMFNPTASGIDDTKPVKL